jgi:metallo-beta-lactamase class B
MLNRAITVVCLLGLASGVEAQERPGGSGIESPAAWTEAIDPFRIADGLYYVGTAGLASYLLTSDEGHILIDAPMRVNTQLVLSNIRRLGFEPDDIRTQLATHAHFDHVGGIASMLEVTGSDLVLSELDAALVADGGGPRALSPYARAYADGVIGHLEIVSVGERTLTAHLTSGHTRGCTSWSGEVEIDGDPLTFVLVCSLSVLPDYRLVGEDETYPGIARDFCNSIAHLRTLDPDIFLANHGGFMGLADKIRALDAGDERAFVDPERYASYLDRAEVAIERVLFEQGHEGGCSAILEAPGTTS